MLSLDLMLLYPGKKGNFKATPLFKETLTALKLLENILIALPRDKKHQLLKNFCCYHLHLTLIFLICIFLCVVILKNSEVLDELPIVEKGFTCSSLLKNMLRHSF